MAAKASAANFGYHHNILHLLCIAQKLNIHRPVAINENGKALWLLTYDCKGKREFPLEEKTRNNPIRC